MGDPTVFALRHGDGRLLVMRAPTAVYARDWAIDLAACVAAAQGRPLVPSPVLRSQEASARAEPAPPPPPRRSAPPDDPPPLQDRLAAPEGAAAPPAAAPPLLVPRPPPPRPPPAAGAPLVPSQGGRRRVPYNESRLNALLAQL